MTISHQNTEFFWKKMSNCEKVKKSNLLKNASTSFFTQKKNIFFLLKKTHLQQSLRAEKMLMLSGRLVIIYMVETIADRVNMCSDELSKFLTEFLKM